MNTKEMEKHVTIIGTLYIAFSIPMLLAAIIVFASVVGGGLLSEDPEAIGVTSIVGTSLFMLLTSFAFPGIICGIGILKRKSWARVFALILGCLNLFAIPFGTALGIYTIWFFVSDEAQVLFSTSAKKT